MLQTVRTEGLLVPKGMIVRGPQAPGTRAPATAIARLGRVEDGARTAIGAPAVVIMMLMMMASVVVAKERAARAEAQARAGRSGEPLARLPDSGGPETA